MGLDPRDALLSLVDIRKRFGPVEVLRGVSLEVSESEVVCLIGRSGSGKTTLLRCINCLETINSGRISLRGSEIGYKQLRRGQRVLKSPQELAVERRKIGMVFQHFNLFPHMTAYENVIEAPLRVAKCDRDIAHLEATRLIEQVGLSHVMNHYPIELSGGQQQRIAIARALAMKPEVMLFDEPTSALDPELVNDVLNVMKDLAHSGMTMIIVSHEMSFARNVADRIVFMEEGRIVESGSPEEVLEFPTDRRTRQFLSNVL